ncbi:hypothetical protein [Polyangium mundeleinium]|uniref:Uncharacterized protein n=1 Tax=Polyangium mundeleinium TaxID=2995306 RepID=A0ABT5EK65_9BACT|nr:hypothetical protein [Polyangium mundeleinium]MDC0742186.1 hypothetical protein [Polyangium mundeleinium]
MRWALLPTLVLPLLGLACDRGPLPAPALASTAAPTSSAPAPAAPNVEDEANACRRRVAEVLASPAAPGAPAFDAARIEILGRARGEPLIFAREPAPTPEDALDARLVPSARLFAKERPGGRIGGLRKRHRGDPRALRALVLREGYAYASDPQDALALVTQITLTDLFDEPRIHLLRGHEMRALDRVEVRREVRYQDAAGKPADLLFGDRVAVTEAELERPLHRDLAALADEIGFERARLRHTTESAIVADLRFGETWAAALLRADGARLSFDCLAEDPPAREAVRAFQDKTAQKRRAMQAIREAVSRAVDEALPFDRPDAEPDHFRDGTLRPQWMTAYLQGRESFSFEEKRYAVFDSSGRPRPPEVCVDFVLDTYERAAGTWYRARGDKPGRAVGRFDFDESGIKNRRGVISFGEFAEAKPELFEVRRFRGEERIPFGERSRFFAELHDFADEVRPGDIISIQGEKRDKHIHQHAIFVERADPVTGFPFGLADQMKRPRRRTWEGIMAEAPKRSLFYRARPRDEVFAKIDPGAP